MCYHILITGPPGVGKTTLIKKIVLQLQNNHIPYNGFYTEEKRENGTRVGFDLVTLNSNEHFPLAKVSNKHGVIDGPSVGRYSVNVKAFESAIQPIFSNNKKAEKTPFVWIIDEIGKMECYSSYFKKVVLPLFKSVDKTIVIATVPADSQLPVVKQICRLPHVELFTVNISNRNHLVSLLTEKLVTLYSKIAKS